MFGGKADCVYSLVFPQSQDTVDGRNPANQLIGSLCMFIPLFTRFYICKVVQDFFHQQYGPGFPNCLRQ